MIAISYHDDLKEVQGDPALAQLLSSPAQTAPFDRIAWWQGLAEHCRLKPLLAVARDGATVAVLPLARAANGLTALANWYSFRWRPIVSPDADGTALLAALARDLRKVAPRIVLDGVTDDHGEAHLLVRAFRGAGWLAALERCDTNHVLKVGGRSYAQYLGARPGALRTTLARKSSKVDIIIHHAFDDASWAEYEAIYQASWKPGEGCPEFLRQFARAEGAAGRLRLGIAYGDLDGAFRAIAAQFWTVEGGTAFIHKLAHVEAAKALSPGSVLSAAMFERAIDCDRVALIDFGTGDDAYKRDWMEMQRPRYRLTLLRHEKPENWPLIARIAARRLAAAARHR